MKKLRSASIPGIVAIFCIATVSVSRAQTFTVLVTFDGPNGLAPLAPLMQSTSGNFLGTTTEGGPHGGGTVFEMRPSGKSTVLYNFCSLEDCDDGRQPYTPVIQAANGSFYGVTTEGGNGSYCVDSNYCGTFFELTTAGKLTTLYNFCSQVNCDDGYFGGSTPVEADSRFYGTIGGGANDFYGSGAGLMYEITPEGAFSILYNFCAQPNCADGADPSGILRGTNGNFYGSTAFGGKNQNGTIFEITPSGQLTTLYNFTGVAGDAGGGITVQARNGEFYGTTLNFSNGAGEIFELTKSGKFTILYTFCSFGCTTELADPGGMIQASDGNFYGTASVGGANSNGAIFKMTPSGKVTTYLSFPSCNYETSCSGGFAPAGLIQGTDGNFYGTMDAGGLLNCLGLAGCGTVYKVTTGLPAFVALNPSYGKAGSAVKILGNGFNRTTSVTFDGTPATFTIVNDTYIRAIVPTGATSGTIEVTTPSGALSSNPAFHIQQ
jgi:uncharacterized repeat protein (TIGR03803 family)